MASVDPSEWRVCEPFAFRGVIVGPGEPVPAEMTEDEAVGLARRRAIGRVDPETGDVQFPEPDEPKTAEDYLNGTAIVVFRRIRRYRPSEELLREMLRFVQDHGRAMHTPLLAEGLKLALMEPLGPDEKL